MGRDNTPYKEVAQRPKDLYEGKGDWLDDAACAGLPVDLWFPGVHSTPGFPAGDQALAICQDCPVKIQCLLSALQEEMQDSQSSIFGIRGGLSPKDRYKLRKKLKNND